MVEDGEAQRGPVLAQSPTAGHGQGWDGDSGLLPTSPGMFPVSSTFSVSVVWVGEWKCLGHPQLTAWGIISKEQRKLSQEGRGLAGCLWFQEAPQGQSPKETDVSTRWWESSLPPKDVRWWMGCRDTLGSPEVIAEVGLGCRCLLGILVSADDGQKEKSDCSTDGKGLGQPGGVWSETVHHSTRGA